MKQRIWRLLNDFYIKIFNRKIGSEMNNFGLFLQNLAFGFSETILESIKEVQEDNKFIRNLKK